MNELPQLIDTHCHLDFPEFDADRDAVIERCRSEGITALINIGATLERSQRSVELAARYAMVYATVGIHPHDADTADERALVRLKELAKSAKVVGIGETGLDYYRSFSQAHNQKELFRRSLSLANDLGLPVVLHCREAADDLMAILKDYLPLRAVVHCFSGDSGFLRQCLDASFMVSFTANITYKKSAYLREVIREVPVERMMLETDCPFLPPEGKRGKRNDPSAVRTVLDEICRIKGMAPEDLARQTTATAKSFFALT